MVYPKDFKLTEQDEYYSAIYYKYISKYKSVIEISRKGFKEIEVQSIY